MAEDVLRPVLAAIKNNVAELETLLYGKSQINVAGINRTTEDAIKALWRIRSAFGIV